MDYSLTVFTPTYNRAHTLPNLYNSLLHQKNNKDFEWLIIDDGSTDETEILVKGWENEHKVDIHYCKVLNGGKPRAINKATQLARSPFLFIVDSDDYLTDDAIAFMLNACNAIKNRPDFVGVGGLRGDRYLHPFKQTTFTEQVDVTNLQRSQYGLDVDCNEVYKVDILKKYPFKVWPGEIFTPESIVLNEMALDGYKLRWFNKVIVISEYLEDGMTKGGWKLMKNNPMGYAMYFNHSLKYIQSIKKRINAVLQMIAHAVLAGNFKYLLNSNDKLLTFICLPIGIILAIRRYLQYRTKV